MASIYVRSSDGNNADNGSTWALAKASVGGAAAIDAAGDAIYVADGHTDDSTSSLTLAFAGTMQSPVQVLSVDDTGDPEPPTALSAGATVTTTGNFSISISGSIYCHGMTFITSSAGGSNNSASLSLASTGNALQRYENCTFKLLSTNTAPNFVLTGSNQATASKMEFIGCHFRTGRADSQRITFNGCDLLIRGGSFQAESGSYTGAVFSPYSASGEGFGSALIENFDLSGCGSTVDIFVAPGAGTNCSGRAVIRNSKLPASWSGDLISTSWPQAIGMRVEMYNCDSGDTTYRLWVAEYGGTILDETTIVRSGGASDGATTLSWKMVSSADVKFHGATLASPEIVRLNTTTGSAITVTVEVVTDGVTLTDEECWVEVQYLGTSGYPLGVTAKDCKTDVLASAANQTSSSETWTTTGLTSPVKQKLSVTFTPQEAGYMHAVVRVAKASTTVYVDPLLTVT